MLTECIQICLVLHLLRGFDGGSMTSDAGAMLLGATDRAIDLIGRFAGCF